MSISVSEPIQSLEPIVILVSINEHLDRLRVAEQSKPLNQRREVPSLADLARISNVPRATLYNLAGRKYESVRLDHLADIINVLREQGFSVTVADLLAEHPISTLPEEEG